MILNCSAGKDSWESLQQQGDQIKSILKEINPEYSLEGLMLKLKLQYFGHLMQRADSLEKTLMLGKMKAGAAGRQRRRWLDGIIGWMYMSVSKLRELVVEREAWHPAVYGVTKSWTQLNDWTTTICNPIALNNEDVYWFLKISIQEG